MTREELIKSLADSLPPVITRAEAAKLTGGLVTASTLATEDCLGTGPKEKIRFGRKVAYPKKSLIDWLINKIDE